MNTDQNVQTTKSSSEEVNVELLQAIQIFMDDLANITGNKNFIDFHTIVKRIDEFKVKSYFTLISGFKVFFDANKDVLIVNDFENLIDPNISYVSTNGAFSFNFYNVFQEAEVAEQEVIKDHLNLIWTLFENKEEKYLNDIIQSMHGTDSVNFDIIKICNEFMSKNLNLSRFIKVACKFTRKRLELEPNKNVSNMLDKIENIDVNNFGVGEVFEIANTLNLNQIISNLFFNPSQPIQFTVDKSSDSSLLVNDKKSLEDSIKEDSKDN
jgi:hypothetical protein